MKLYILFSLIFAFYILLKMYSYAVIKRFLLNILEFCFLQMNFNIFCNNFRVWFRAGVQFNFSHINCHLMQNHLHICKATSHIIGLYKPCIFLESLLCSVNFYKFFMISYYLHWDRFTLILISNSVSSVNRYTFIFKIILFLNFSYKL